MKIAFDNQIFLRQKFGGVSREFCEISNELNKLDGIESEIIAPLHFNLLLNNYESSIRNIYVPKWPNRYRKVVNSLSDLLGDRYLRKFKPNIFQETHYTMKALQFSGPRFITVNDMIREKIDFNKERLKLKRISVKRADHVICISKNTEQDLHHYIPESLGKTSVIYLGVSDIFRYPQNDFGKGGFSIKPYYLFVGDRSGYKNFDNFLSAFARSSAYRKHNAKIICFGGGKFTQSELIKISELGMSNSCEHISGDDLKLVNYYQNALALVYPSRYEGFGLPPLEAMAVGCPVISSKGGSLPEILSDAALFFDLDSTESLQKALDDIIDSNTLRQTLIQKGRKLSPQFSWKNTALKHAELYKQFG